MALGELIRQLCKELSCAICLSLLENPFSTPCAHQFCHGCIVKALSTHEKCPLCQKKMTKRSIAKNVTAEKLVTLLKGIIQAYETSIGGALSQEKTNNWANWTGNPIENLSQLFPYPEKEIEPKVKRKLEEEDCEKEEEEQDRVNGNVKKCKTSLDIEKEETSRTRRRTSNGTIEKETEKEEEKEEEEEKRKKKGRLMRKSDPSNLETINSDELDSTTLKTKSKTLSPFNLPVNIQNPRRSGRLKLTNIIEIDSPNEKIPIQNQQGSERKSRKKGRVEKNEEDEKEKEKEKEIQTENIREMEGDKKMKEKLHEIDNNGNEENEENEKNEQLVSSDIKMMDKNIEGVNEIIHQELNEDFLERKKLELNLEKQEKEVKEKENKRQQEIEAIEKQKNEIIQRIQNQSTMEEGSELIQINDSMDSKDPLENIELYQNQPKLKEKALNEVQKDVIEIDAPEFEEKEIPKKKSQSNQRKDKNNFTSQYKYKSDNFMKEINELIGDKSLNDSPPALHRKHSSQSQILFESPRTFLLESQDLLNIDSSQFLQHTPTSQDLPLLRGALYKYTKELELLNGSLDIDDIVDNHLMNLQDKGSQDLFGSIQGTDKSLKQTSEQESGNDITANQKLKTTKRVTIQEYTENFPNNYEKDINKTETKIKQKEIDEKLITDELIEENQNFVLLPTGLDQVEMRELKKVAEILNGKTVANYCPSVTHVITRNVAVEKGERRSNRTLKYFRAILGGKWLVTYEWIKECLKEQKHVPEIDYEIHGDDLNTDGGPRKAREILSKKEKCDLFRGYSIFLAGGFEQPSKEELRDLIEISGGRVVDNIVDPFKFCESEKNVIISDSIDEDERNDLKLSFGMRPVSSTWFLDSISEFMVRSKSPYFDSV